VYKKYKHKIQNVAGEQTHGMLQAFLLCACVPSGTHTQDFGYWPAAEPAAEEDYVLV
jgi:hypothetical protein